MAEIYLIVGLGNPGPKYQKTRHNMGWWVIDELTRRYDLGSGRAEQRAQTWDGTISGKRIKLVKPLTFMNRSGESVRSLLDYYRISPEQMLVIHDDLDTPFGVLRLRVSGGHGGQNGLRSIIQHLGRKDFARLRFGIGRPPGKMDPIDYVLQPYAAKEYDEAQELTLRAADAVESWLQDGIDKAMSAFNGDAGQADKKRQAMNLDEQLRLCQRARELAPRDPKPLAKLIAVEKKMGMLDQAVEHHLLLAKLLEASGKPDLAIAEKVKAVTVKPGMVEIQREIADWYYSQDNNKKAVSRYLILADHYRKQNDLAAARATVETALGINPQHPKALEIRSLLGENLTE